MAWSRTVDAKGITLRVFKRDSTGRTYMATRTMHPHEVLGQHGRSNLARTMMALRVQVRWAVDQIEFALLGLQDNTPPPTSPWMGQPPPFPAPAGHEWVEGSWGFNCSGKPRQDPPRLVPSDTVPRLGGAR